MRYAALPPYIWKHEYYQGEYKDGLFHGFGNYNHPDKIQYIGEWKDGKRHGQGSCIKEHEGNAREVDSKYIGEWKDDKKHGHGNWRGLFQENNTYVGEYKNDRWHGFGTRTFEDDKYVGNHFNGEQKGQGTKSFGNGDKYEGGWLRSSFHGQGTYTASNGKQLEGQWKYDYGNDKYFLSKNNMTIEINICKESKDRSLDDITTKLKELGIIEKERTYDGWVYILINGFFPKNTLKIGMTRRTPEIRAREMSDETGMPSEFYVAHEREVYDCEEVEKLVHKELKHYRITGQRKDRDREFFKLPLQKAIETMNKIVDEE